MSGSLAIRFKYFVKDLKDIGFWCVGFAESGAKRLDQVDLRIEQFLNLLGVADGVCAACDGAGDRTGLDPLAIGAHEHFRRRGHKKFAVAEIDQRAVRRRIDLAQALEHLRRRALAGFGE